MDAIEKCVAKFGMLLRVGFGEAGMSIVAKNVGTSVHSTQLYLGKNSTVFGFVIFETSPTAVKC